MKHVAIARIFVGYKFTEIAPMNAAQRPALMNVTKAIRIEWNSVKNTKLMEHPAEIDNQTAEKRVAKQLRWWDKNEELYHRITYELKFVAQSY